MLIIKKELTATILALLSTTTVIADDFNKSIEKALKFGQDDAKYGQIKLDIRYRFEYVDSTNPRRELATASTLHYRIGYLTPVFKGLQAYGEFERNQAINDHYDSGINGNTQYERVTDPQRSSINQLWLSYKGIPQTEAKLGRQNILLDNGRFIATSTWRQVARTFDSILIVNKSLPNTDIVVGYIDKVKNIDASMINTHLPLVNISYSFPDIGKLTAYSYWMDLRETRLYNASSQNYGVRFEGMRKANDAVALHYLAEYDNQSGYGNSQSYQVDYYHLMGGFSYLGFTVKGAMEQLGGNGPNKTFNTPFALLNKFNGWADVFLATPDNGLRDVYASVDKELMGVKLSGVYHDFSDDTGRKRYGDEWDFMFTKEFFKHYSLMARYSYFNADADGRFIGKFDTQKIWIGAGITF